MSTPSTVSTLSTLYTCLYSTVYVYIRFFRRERLNCRGTSLRATVHRVFGCIIQQRYHTGLGLGGLRLVLFPPEVQLSSRRGDPDPSLAALDAPLAPGPNRRSGYTGTAAVTGHLRYIIKEPVFMESYDSRAKRRGGVWVGGQVGC